MNQDEKLRQAVINYRNAIYVRSRTMPIARREKPKLDEATCKELEQIHRELLQIIDKIYAFATDVRGAIQRVDCLLPPLDNEIPF